MQKIAFIGTGNMAEAIIGGLLRKGFRAGQIRGTTHSPDTARAAAERLGIQVDTDNDAAAEWADVLVLAVKPQKLATVCDNLRATVGKAPPLVISVAAGVTSDTIEKWLNASLAVVRCMPNTPSLLGQGVSGLYANARVSADGRALAENILSAVGLVHWVGQEDDLHLITAYCGSAPAYFYRFTESLMRSAEHHGMAPDTARRLITEVALGAARMMTETGDDPASLRARVSSPGGTTERALMTFDEQQLDRVIEQAASACIDRSEELSRQLANPAADRRED